LTSFIKSYKVVSIFNQTA